MEKDGSFDLWWAIEISSIQGWDFWNDYTFAYTR